MSKKKILLIAGCSHAAGAESCTLDDSVINRETSYGNKLAILIGHTPINIASPGATNTGIARSVLLWFDREYDPMTMDVFVLVSWTSIRLEVLYDITSPGYTNPIASWDSGTDRLYKRIIVGYKGATFSERRIHMKYHKFIANNEIFFEIATINLVLQLQYFLNSKSIKYLMNSATDGIVTSHHQQLDAVTCYTDLIDTRRFVNVFDNTKSFFTLYNELGFTNPTAKWGHHSAEPHTLYSMQLFDFITDNNLL